MSTEKNTDRTPGENAEGTGTQGGISVTRVLDAPPERVFRAWTTPEQFAAWYGGDAEAPLDRVTMDVRPGGEWSLVLLVPDHGEMPFHGVYREVNAPGRLVLTLKDGGAPEDIEGEIVTVTFAGVGGRTEMVFHQGGGNLSAEQYQQARGGWEIFFDTLAQVLRG
ncbi:SRPBCC domain-containing protein [Streptomyces sp. NBC_00859]|uniref:SRPBCC family protein n=1 Tax=Streptomyces sp. NBC_00859 TaxID=2903682 RepID=UPI00386FBA96|nr:SRPBCC domain-containing protein [Streptomyces sp. NBC_00859]